jgi:hypothetical protein
MVVVESIVSARHKKEVEHRVVSFETLHENWLHAWLLAKKGKNVVPAVGVTQFPTK